jgi:hypothetical protein
VPTVFVPLRRLEAEALAAGRADVAARPGYAATPGLLRAHGLLEPAGEEADYTALAYAGAAALRNGDPLRLVAAVWEDEPAPAGDPDDGLGRVLLSHVRWERVSALFCDEPVNLPALERARRMGAGLDLEQILDSGEIESLLDACDLLWYDPAELARLPSH